VALSTARIIAVRDTPYPHERDGIEFAEKGLPDTDPYDFVDAITRHEFPGADPRHQGGAIDRPTMRAVVQTLTSIGFRPRKGKLNAGSYELGALLDETQSFQDREAVHRSIPSQRRASTYLVPEQTSVERRQQLLRPTLTPQRPARHRQITVDRRERSRPAIREIPEPPARRDLGRHVRSSSLVVRSMTMGCNRVASCRVPVVRLQTP
jgi:hypothetical protein